jgi:hypothetical protein
MFSEIQREITYDYAVCCLSYEYACNTIFVSAIKERLEQSRRQKSQIKWAFVKYISNLQHNLSSPLHSAQKLLKQYTEVYLLPSRKVTQTIMLLFYIFQVYRPKHQSRHLTFFNYVFRSIIQSILANTVALYPSNISCAPNQLQRIRSNAKAGAT